MKIFWLVNIIMPELAEHLRQKPSVAGGWLTGAMEAVRESGHGLVICTTGTEHAGRYEVGGVVYYICRAEAAAMKQILENEKPDVVHIYGTEFRQSMELAQVADPERLLITIQGALTYYKDAVYAGIPEAICKDTLLHKLLRFLGRGGESIERQKRSFEERAKYEQAALLQARYINGGSEWGSAVARAINPACRTLDCGLILRSAFYTDERWDISRCERHSVFILHSYPIKGFHKFLEALKILVHRYPDIKVHVVASKVHYRHCGKVKTAIMNAAPDYNWYVQQIIEENRLEKHLIFEGRLKADEMKAKMLKANVFVSASAIENQSTTLGEAMILGVPAVASCVGAIQEMIDDGEDGFIYPFQEPYILADRISRIFEDDALASRFSERGRAHALHTYDREENQRRLLEMYKTIDENAKENG